MSRHPNEQRRESTLEAFLNCVQFVLPNFNDTFGYACADTEKLSVSEGEIMELWWNRHGWHGLVALAAWKRGQHPLAEVAAHDAYKAALADLRGDEQIACSDDPSDTERWTWWFFEDFDNAKGLDA